MEPALSAAERFILYRGSLAHIWSRIEDYLDYWVEYIHLNGGAKRIQPMLPPNLDRELDYLKEALKVGLVHEQNRADATRLIESIHRIKGFRHTLIHGVAVDIGDDGRVVFDHCRVRGAARVYNRTTFTQAQLMRHYDRSRKLMTDLRTFLFGEDVLELGD